MKKLILSVLAFIVALSSISLANCIGDISQVSNVKCVTEYSNGTTVGQWILLLLVHIYSQM